MILLGKYKKKKETLHTYKNITHIYSTDETSPIMNAEYAKDLNTVINNMQAQIINNSVDEKYSELRLEKNENQIKITDIKSFNLNTEAMRYRLIRKILTELIGNIQGIEMIHIKDTCKLLESRITGKQYILGNKYRVVIEKKNVAMFTTSK